MGRLASGVSVTLIACGAGLLVGCSHSQAVTSTTSGPVPAIITLTPSPTLSLEVGTTETFTATPESSSATAVTTTVSYQSTNPSVLTISTSGLACAGTWDSLSSPTMCTPGPAGVAQVIATADGVSSPATTVYVHQHIDSIVVTPVPGQTQPLLGPGPCFSKGQSFEYQATAFSGGTDITSTVGTFQWQAVNGFVVSLTTVPVATSANGLQPGQTLATANIPGTTTIFAGVNDVASAPFTFTTCAVQSITLALDGAASNAVTVAPSGTATITATVIDTNHNSITGTFLTWCSTNPSSVAVGGSNCTTGSTTNFPATAQTSGGGASIIASCTPPSCNIGFVPAMPIYPSYPYTPSNPPAPVPTLQPLWVEMTISNNGSTTVTSTSTSAWVTSTGCGTLQGCVSEIAEITSTSGSSSSSTGAGVSSTTALAATPNSLVFDPKGARAFLGTDRGELGTKGVMVLDPSGGSTTLYPSAVGKVLAVSPDGTVAVLSDTVDTPNQVYIFTCTGTGSGTCGSTTSVPLNITGATAAAFSSDGLKAFILADNGNASTLYIYSTLDALETVPLSSTAPATDVAFQAEGGFAYIAGGAASAVSTLAVCSDLAAPAVTTIPTAGTPLLIRALPDGNMLALDPPGFDLLVPTVGVSSNGCSVPRPPYAAGNLSVSNTASFLNLGLGNFIPIQWIVSGDGSATYLLASNAGAVLVSNITQRTTSAIQLTGNVLPVQAALNPDGSMLFVAATDGQVHILNTLTENDIQQISFQQDLANLETGLCGNVTLPLPGVINITAAAQSGPSTTYTYTISSVPALEVGMSIAVANMGNPGNNGTFTVESVGSGTFTVANPAGVSAGGQSGSGTFSFTCNPDLIAIQP